jgi:Protein of unknown function (DUF2587)
MTQLPDLGKDKLRRAMAFRTVSVSPLGHNESMAKKPTQATDEQQYGGSTMSPDLSDTPSTGQAVLPPNQHADIAEVISGPGVAEPIAETTETETISSPGKVMRIGSMIKQLLEEVRQAPLDERSRVRLREVYQQSVKELASSLSPDLREELEQLALPFADSEVPSESELRIAQAQLVGWLEGLFHGIQATLFAQQMAAQAQLQQMRQLGMPGAEGEQGAQGAQQPQQHRSGPIGGGTYL